MTPIAAREMLAAMVCGLPFHKRRKWLLCMLVSYADDSGSDKKGPVYVLAGYVSSVHQWQSFSDAWHVGLNSGPRPLEYFKMQEAAFSGKGQFKRWRKPERDAKLLELANIIQNHVMFAVTAVLWWEDFKMAQAQYPQYQVNPYCVLFNHIMSSAVIHVMGLHITEKIDFVFDDQGRIGDMAQASYRIAQRAIPPEMLEYVAGPPNHKSDRVVLPLQAADMFAWQARRFCYENEKHGTNHRSYTFHPVMKILNDIPMEQSTLHIKNLRSFFVNLKKKFPKGF